jgi:transcriptional regulator with XRE-family HTH domain
MGQVNEQLKQAREDAGLSKAAIAALIQVPEATYIEWECRGRIPRMNARVALAGALKMTLPELNRILHGNEGSSSGTIRMIFSLHLNVSLAS